MDVAEMVVTAGGAALVAFTLWFFFGKKGRGGGAVAEKGEGGSTMKQEDLYACPMHPWITSKDPAADCSICGMKLVRGGHQ